MKHLLPRFDLCRWSGPDVTDQHDCTGWCVTVQWLGLIVDLAVARVRG